MNSQFCDLADGIALFTYVEDLVIEEITLELSNKAAADGLLFDVKKTSSWRWGSDEISEEDICIYGVADEIINDFCYLGNFIYDNCNYDRKPHLAVLAKYW